MMQAFEGKMLTEMEEHRQVFVGRMLTEMRSVLTTQAFVERVLTEMEERGEC
jgi:hypothetical protein